MGVEDHRKSVLDRMFLFSKFADRSSMTVSHPKMIAVIIITVTMITKTILIVITIIMAAIINGQNSNLKKKF